MNRTLHRIFVVFCWAGAVVLVLNTVRLVRENRQLSQQVIHVYRSMELPIGAVVPPIEGVDRFGRKFFLDSRAESLPVLVLVFSPTCPACDQNWPLWDSLVAAQQLLGGKIITFDMTGRVREEYLRVHGIDAHPCLVSLTPETTMSFRFRFTPQTYILHEGKVVYGWTGVLHPSEIERAMDYLSNEN